MIIVDSNIWVFAEVQSAPEHTAAAAKLRDALTTDGVGLNVVITSEVFHVLRRLLGSSKAAVRMSHILRHPAVNWLEFGPSSVLFALGLASKFEVRINDALIAQQALEHKAEVLTDNVKDFRKVKAVKIIPLRR